PTQPRLALEPAQEKHRLFQALSTVLLNSQTVQFVVIEDLHWCDDNSFEFLLYLARRIADYPTMLMLTYRSDEVHPTLRHFLAELDRERLAVELPLSGLSRDEVDTLIRAIFPQPGPVRGEFLDALYNLTEGNPFFLEEVLKSLLASGDIFYQEGRWTRKPVTALAIPRSVQDAVARRVEQVSPPASRLLGIAAVVGRRFDFALLQSITGQSEAELLELLKELISAQLVAEESDDRFTFRHALTQQAVYRGLLARERRALHDKIAQTIEGIGGGGQAEEHLPELAYHSYQAADWERTLRYARLAGEQAVKLYAPQAACEQFDRAIEAATHLGQAPEAALYRYRGQANETLGRFEAAHADYTCALETARHAVDRLAEWQSLFDLGFLWTGRNFSEAQGYLDSALELARIIGQAEMLAHSLNRVGNWYANNEQQQKAIHFHEEALTLFEKLGDDAGQAATLDLLGISSLIGGNLPACAAYYERAVELFRKLGDKQGLASSLGPYSLCGGSYMAPTLTGPLASAEACRRGAEEAVSLMRQIGSRSGEAFALMFLALNQGARGGYRVAWPAAHECIALSSEIGHMLTLAGGHFALGALYLELMMPEEARLHTQEALNVSLRSNSPFLIGSSSAFHARACVMLRDIATANETLNAALPEDAPLVTVPQRLVAGARVEVALARRKPEEALRLVSLLAESQLPSAGVAPVLSYWRAKARLMEGNGATAVAALEEALAAARTRELEPLVWRVEVELGHLYHAQGRRLDATACWQDARRVIRGLEEQLTDEQVRTTFLRNSARLMPIQASPTDKQTSKQMADGLTGRELDVARLVVQGKSNREIAEELVLSQRTVQVHITNILGKLGFESRAQIAAWVVQKGLAAPQAAGPLPDKLTE
ncbi:MAG TPA: LuxR C-terminal-related transcriptional regulator, partial [Chloroflexia bacterium]|nr:LuxR C-terminal-related transcriptional regulator [Chloroflexia bacterium]